MTIRIRIIRPEIVALINGGLKSGGFKDAGEVILQALKSSEPARPSAVDRSAAIERLKTFGKANNVSLAGTAIRELRDEARP